MERVGREVSIYRCLSVKKNAFALNTKTDENDKTSFSYDRISLHF